MEYRAISLRQPWATLIAIGAKVIETRSWTTSYRGRLLIHASAAMTPYQRKVHAYTYFQEALSAAGFPLAEDLPLGVIVAECDLADVLPQTSGRFFQPWVRSLSEKERTFGEYGPGRYGFFLKNVRKTPLIKARGSLSLWTPQPEVMTQLLDERKMTA